MERRLRTTTAIARTQQSKAAPKANAELKFKITCSVAYEQRSTFASRHDTHSDLATITGAKGRIAYKSRAKRIYLNQVKSSSPVSPCASECRHEGLSAPLASPASLADFDSRAWRHDFRKGKSFPRQVLASSSGQGGFEKIPGFPETALFSQTLRHGDCYSYYVNNNYTHYAKDPTPTLRILDRFCFRQFQSPSRPKCCTGVGREHRTEYCRLSIIYWNSERGLYSANRGRE
jgi:hypothetical protein